MTADLSANDSQANSAQALEQLVSRAQALYSLPAVAAEVIELTSNPKVDVRALKECIQTDPALTAKILRVVNSSLFGLSREVSDLNQAIALLGTKPLKLLVLGFSLPQELFSGVAREQLDWYWSTTLARAVAARAISERLYERAGDDAFLAGLLQDIGVLALLGQLKEPYATFLSTAIAEHVDLRRVEVESLGFDHLALTAALLNQWKIPELLVQGIAEPRVSRILEKQHKPHSQLARILHLADLLAELVGSNRLDVLPDLLEVGDLYCGIDRECLNDLIAYMQPQVKQLAEVLSLQLPDGLDYAQVISNAHEQMSLLAEDMATSEGAPITESANYDNVLADASHLRSAMDAFLQQPAIKIMPESEVEKISVADNQNAARAPRNVACQSQAVISGFSAVLTLTVGQCRSQRKPVSLVLMAVEGDHVLDEVDQKLIGRLLDSACAANDIDDLVVEPLSLCRRALLLPDFDRQQAVQFAQLLIGKMRNALAKLESQGSRLDCLPNAGVASVTLPPKNFPPTDLLDTASRCLSAAQAGDASSVKSLEIY